MAAKISPELMASIINDFVQRWNAKYVDDGPTYSVHFDGSRRQFISIYNGRNTCGGYFFHKLYEFCDERGLPIPCIYSNPNEGRVEIYFLP